MEERRAGTPVEWYRHRLDEACDSFGMWPGRAFVIGHGAVGAVAFLLAAAALHASGVADVDPLKGAGLGVAVGLLLALVVVSVAGGRRLWRQWAESGFARRPARAADRTGRPLPLWWGPMMRQLPLAMWLTIVTAPVAGYFVASPLIRHLAPGWFGPAARRGNGMSAGEIVSLLAGVLASMPAMYAWGWALRRRGLLPAEDPSED